MGIPDYLTLDGKRISAQELLAYNRYLQTVLGVYARGISAAEFQEYFGIERAHLYHGPRRVEELQQDPLTVVMKDLAVRLQNPERKMAIKGFIDAFCSNNNH